MSEIIKKTRTRKVKPELVEDPKPIPAAIPPVSGTATCGATSKELCKKISKELGIELKPKPTRPKRILSDEQKAVLRERLVNARAAKVTKRAPAILA